MPLHRRSSRATCSRERLSALSRLSAYLQRQPVCERANSVNALTGRLDWPRVSCRAGEHTYCYEGERRRRLPPWHGRPICTMCEAAHTMRVPRGTRGPARTSPWRSKEALPTLTMTVDEQHPPARMAAEGAGGPGFARFSPPVGLTLRGIDDVQGHVQGQHSCPGTPTVHSEPPFPKKPGRGATTPHDNAAPRPKTPRHTRKDDGLCAAQSVRRRNGDRPPATASAHERA